MDFVGLRARYDKLVEETEALERKLAELADERKAGAFETDLNNFLDSFPTLIEIASQRRWKKFANKYDMDSKGEISIEKHLIICFLAAWHFAPGHRRGASFFRMLCCTPNSERGYNSTGRQHSG